MSVTELHPPGVLGCSRVGAAIGVGFTSPIRVFGEITRKDGFARDGDLAHHWWGRELQPLLFKRLTLDGYSVVENDATMPSYELRDATRPWLVGHPDGFGVSEHDGLVVDTKTQSWPYADLSADVQLLTYMHLGGYAGGLLATLRGLSLDVREVERRQDYIDTILYLAERFMEYVRADEWPPVTGHPDDRAAITTANPLSVPGKKRRETKEVRDARRELKMMRDADGKHGARKRRENYLTGIVTAHMGDAEELISFHDETVARWPSYERRTFDKKRLEKDNPELVAAYTTTTAERRLTLT